jgi:hypothetical protein
MAHRAPGAIRTPKSLATTAPARISVPRGPPCEASIGSPTIPFALTGNASRTRRSPANATQSAIQLFKVSMFMMFRSCSRSRTPGP